MFKVEYELLPKSVTQMFTKNKDIHSHNTRNRNLLRMSTGTKNFSYHSARIWNTIASKISINVSLSQFKATLKNYLLHNPFVYTGMRFFRNFADRRGHFRGNPRSGLIFMGGGGGGTILCLLADCQQCWDGTTYIPHYQPILNAECVVAGVCTTSTCSIA